MGDCVKLYSHACWAHIRLRLIVDLQSLALPSKGQWNPKAKLGGSL